MESLTSIVWGGRHSDSKGVLVDEAQNLKWILLLPATDRSAGADIDTDNNRYISANANNNLAKFQHIYFKAGFYDINRSGSTFKASFNLLSRTSARGERRLKMEIRFKRDAFCTRSSPLLLNCVTPSACHETPHKCTAESTRLFVFLIRGESAASAESFHESIFCFAAGGARATTRAGVFLL
ncbi:hypothetical protein EVAR_28995_1 [Eumeta japonica]|uniref:Uncharacterized protein n=1 Tax=Eumeta variegata TaxID=151549 RepID=A0A4C1W5A0_EUMVA|nr:hypothetical protein EVAR_28995_1 [Eumeta japonica]